LNPPPLNGSDVEELLEDIVSSSSESVRALLPPPVPPPPPFPPAPILPIPLLPLPKEFRVRRLSLLFRWDVRLGEEAEVVIGGGWSEEEVGRGMKTR